MDEKLITLSDSFSQSLNMASKKVELMPNLMHRLALMENQVKQFFPSKTSNSVLTGSVISN